MSKHILITEVNGVRYSTTLYNVLTSWSDDKMFTVHFTDGQEDKMVPKTEYISLKRAVTE